MGLTVKKLQRLKDKQFHHLYTANQAEWEALLENAVQFLDRTLPQGERILPDDLQQAMSDIVAVSPVFRQYCEENSLQQQYWAEYFADYIIDRRFGKEIVQRSSNP